jgi:hypothetical protein
MPRRRSGAARAREAALLRDDLVAFVRARMPWPYVDVDRDSREAQQQARLIAQPLAEILAREFDEIRASQEGLS